MNQGAVASPMQYHNARVTPLPENFLSIHANKIPYVYKITCLPNSLNNHAY